MRRRTSYYNNIIKYIFDVRNFRVDYPLRLSEVLFKTFQFTTYIILYTAQLDVCDVYNVYNIILYNIIYIRTRCRHRQQRLKQNIFYN